MSVRVIGIGASAGGLQALESFFSEIPLGLGVAFVVVQHLSVNHASSMDSILQRATNLTVSMLDKDTIPQADHVYIKSPEYEVNLNHLLHLTPRKLPQQGLYLPIDAFFFSLAASQQEASVAIVLSGMGTDGSRGLKEIKAHGGLVMVQDPSTAQFDGMPTAALRQNIADVILPPGQLASRLAMILRHDGVTGQAPLTDDIEQGDLFQSLLRRIHAISRINFGHYRTATIRRRIEKRMLITQHESLQRYMQYALRNDPELQILRQSFLIGVTRFFRDAEAFDQLRDLIIPELFKQLPEHQDLRIWVPSCSTGEEVYSIAMLVEDYLEQQQLRRNYKIFGSDVDRRSIVVATHGQYDASIQADVPADYLHKYFTPTSQGYRVRSDLQEHLLFAVQNLLEDPPFIRIDLISCRNFLIYIDGEAQQQVLSNFHFGLNPAGYLLLGPSEHLGSLQSAFAPVDRRWKLYKKRDDLGGIAPNRRVSVPPYPTLRTSAPGSVQAVTPYSDEYDSIPPTTNSARPLLSGSTMDEYARFLSERYAPSTLFVNRQYDIIYLSGEFTGILSLPRFNAQLSLRTVLNEEVQSLVTAGVDRVLSSQRAGLFERINVAAQGLPPRYLKVRFGVFESASSSEPLAMLEFLPVETVPEHSQQPEEEEEAEVYSVDRRLMQKVTELESELQRSERRAQKLYNELEATNEELQSSNRELLASNEEMQSTNEELQSVNEELYTVNNEFQRKNDELNAINNDINNLLKSTQISTIFVDKQLNIRRFTPGIGQQFDFTVSDLGRPLTVFANPFRDVDIEATSREVLRTTKRYDQEVQDGNGDYYLLRMLPYLTETDQVEGVVITFVDINDLVRTRQRLTDMARKYEAIFHTTQEVIAIVRNNSRIEDVNRPLADYTTQQLVGMYFTDLIDDAQGKVQFTEALRQSFDQHRLERLTLTLRPQEEEMTKVEMEFIPIAVKSDAEPASDTVEQAMIIIRDITSLENERLIFLNQRSGLAYQAPHYVNRKIGDMLTPAGLQRYRMAVERLQAGESSVTVTYPVEELAEETVPLTVVYRPIFSRDRIVLISFEIEQAD
ncbi:chemotaxis protein CheB [Neolewinella sp.]|uniref:chemotaxis protein CheB n=1 Tax=Neolewinella sp. TaxID=2993543 RepID=UPI003B52716B